MKKAIVRALENAKKYINQNDLKAAEAALDWAIEEIQALEPDDLVEDEEQNDDDLGDAG